MELSLPPMGMEVDMARCMTQAYPCSRPRDSNEPGCRQRRGALSQLDLFATRMIWALVRRPPYTAPRTTPHSFFMSAQVRSASENILGVHPHMAVHFRPLFSIAFAPLMHHSVKEIQPPVVPASCLDSPGPTSLSHTLLLVHYALTGSLACFVLL